MQSPSVSYLHRYIWGNHQPLLKIAAPLRPPFMCIEQPCNAASNGALKPRAHRLLYLLLFVGGGHRRRGQQAPASVRPLLDGGGDGGRHGLAACQRMRCAAARPRARAQDGLSQPGEWGGLLWAVYCDTTVPSHHVPRAMLACCARRVQCNCQPERCDAGLGEVGRARSHTLLGCWVACCRRVGTCCVFKGRALPSADEATCASPWRGPLTASVGQRYPNGTLAAGEARAGRSTRVTCAAHPILHGPGGHLSPQQG